MATSILTSTKQILGIASGYTVYDADIIMHINSALSTASQLGVGPTGGFFINDATTTWEDLSLPDDQLSMLRTYVFLKTRYAFDPPQMGYLVEAVSNQIKEYEWRLNMFREVELP